MHVLVNLHRRLAERGVACRNHDRVSQIVTVKNNSTAGPAPHDVAIIRCDVVELSKIPE